MHVGDNTEVVIDCFCPLCYQEQVEQSEKNVDDHENFLQRHKACADWLTNAQQQLDSCSDTVGDEDALNVRRDVIEVGWFWSYG